ncbi:MAG: sigma-70 family RNA polymerase sigma factor [Acidobacteria bacterium]|nr:sigma-70 family RNA polymerase sigma factor [Acidobacteriota bacterium]
MVNSTPCEVTQLLRAWNDGDELAFEQLVPVVQAELHRLAQNYIGRERPGHLLQTTALVNEAWLRLIDWQNVSWQNRAHFYGAAASIMRRILVDEARNRQRQKRGGGALQVSLTNAAGVSGEKTTDLVALDDALQSLAEIDSRKSKIVELRFFGGLTVEETAEVLKLSARQVARDWNLAQAWLFRELNGGRHAS